MQVVRNAKGVPLVHAFTSDRFIPAEWSHHQLVPGWTLFEAISDSPVFLDLNPGTPVSPTMS